MTGCRIAVLALAAASLAGCGDRSAGDGGDGEAGTGARPAARPLLPSEAARLEPTYVIADEGRLGHPRDLAVDESGNVYVLDFAVPSGILKYDAEGRFLLRFGTRPEEQEPVSAIEMDLAPWNTLLVVDRGRNALATYLLIGTFASSVTVRSAVALDAHGLPGFGEFYLHQWDTEGRRSSVLHMRAPYDSLHTTYEVRIPADASVRQEARAVHYHTATDRQGRLYVAFYDGYPVRVLEPDGRTVSVIDLDRRPVRKTPDEIRVETERNLERLRESAPGMDESLLLEAAQPDTVWPVIEELAVDPLGRLWIRTGPSGRRGATTYDVFNERGEYLVRVELPGRVERTVFAPDGRLFAIVADETGDRGVVGFAVTIGEPTDPQPTEPQPTSVSGT